MEGLDDVVLGAELQATNAVLGIAEGRKEDDGGRGFAASDRLGQVKAQAVGQADIEKREIKATAAAVFRGVGERRAPGDVEALLVEALDERGTDVGFVLDEEDRVFG